jgi:hypothetical protein
MDQVVEPAADPNDWPERKPPAAPFEAVFSVVVRPMLSFSMMLSSGRSSKGRGPRCGRLRPTPSLWGTEENWCGASRLSAGRSLADASSPGRGRRAPSGRRPAVSTLKPSASPSAAGLPGRRRPFRGASVAGCLEQRGKSCLELCDVVGEEGEVEALDHRHGAVGLHDLHTFVGQQPHQPTVCQQGERGLEGGEPTRTSEAVMRRMALRCGVGMILSRIGEVRPIPPERPSPRQGAVGTA